MKKLISILILSFALASCETPKHSEESVLNDLIGGGQMVKVRGCEYIKSHVYLGSVYTHCGDCSNPIHKK